MGGLTNRSTLVLAIVASLDSRAKAATGEAKLDAQVADLQAQWLVLDGRLADLKKATAEKWQEAKASFDEQMKEIKQSLDRDHEPRKQGCRIAGQSEARKEEEMKSMQSKFVRSLMIGMTTSAIAALASK